MKDIKNEIEKVLTNLGYKETEEETLKNRNKSLELWDKTMQEQIKFLVTNLNKCKEKNKELIKENEDLKKKLNEYSNLKEKEISIDKIMEELKSEISKLVLVNQNSHNDLNPWRREFQPFTMTFSH